MAKKTIVNAGVFEAEFDNTVLLERFGKQRFRVAVNNALRAVGGDYAKRVFEGFAKQGVDPRSGRGGFWPKLKIPSGATRKGGRTKRGKILKKSGKYFKSISPKNARVVIKGNDNNKSMTVRYRGLPKYAHHHEQAGNQAGFTKQIATAKQAGLLRALGYRGAHAGSVIILPARRVFVYPPTWKGVHAKLFKKVLSKLWS